MILNNLNKLKYVRLAIFFLIGGLTAIQPDISTDIAEKVTLALAVLGALKSVFPSK